MDVGIAPVSARKDQRSESQDQCGRHYNRPDFRNSPRAAVFALAPERDQPKDGRQRAGHGKIGAEIHADQKRAFDRGGSMGWDRGRLGDKPRRQVVHKVGCECEPEPGDQAVAVADCSDPQFRRR